MNKKTVALIMAGVMSLSLAACGSEEVDETLPITINPVSQVSETGDLAMGDVMPFYDGKAFNVYHLQNTVGSNSMWYHPIACVSTTDFVHYEERGVALNFEEYPDSPDAALGTGSFIRDKAGNVHCFYTGHNPDLKPVEVIRHAVSMDDQKTWIKDDSFSMKNGKDDFRDPYLYYDAEAELYRMLVTTRKDDVGIVARYSCPTLSGGPDDWLLDSEPFFVNDSGTYNMECPAYFVYNGFHYLTYSEQGDHRVTHYRYKKNAGDAWGKPDIDFIDGEGFYAGRPEQANGELYCFAWCAETTTRADYGAFDWAGNLVVHKLKQKVNGELYPVMIPSVKAAVNKEVEYELCSGGKLSELSFEADKFAAKTVNALKSKVTRMSFKFKLSTLGGDCGMSFGIKGSDNNVLGNAVVAFDAKGSAFSYYNDVFSAVRYRTPLVTTPFTFEKDKEYTVDVIIDGQIISVYFSGQLATTIRIYSMPGNNFAFYSNGAGVSFKDIRVYE